MRLRTERMILRAFDGEDLPLFAELNADPRVMEFLGGPVDEAEARAMLARVEESTRRNGFSFLCAEIPGVTRCAGFIGLNVPRWQAHFTPCVEIGWRLATRYWGQGYAFEGARAAMAHGFDVLGLAEIVAETAPGNLRSRALMIRLGMSHDPADDFHLADDPADQPAHVLYRRSREDR